ncbi:hypothetical protein [Haliangium ochraceum]|uniref:hypothetical protein n=1 Tax=Haliangium ochraceum TaxID=80816 RepID=UPI0002F5ED07|nr:hypothetical protein [Haliangium ochraceum]
MSASRHPLLWTLLHALLIGALLGASGCVTSHENGDYLTEAQLEDSDFYGYLDQPLSSVSMQMFNHATESWTTVASATSQSFGFNYGDMDLYQWSIQGFDFKAVPQWACYWDLSGNCNPDFVWGQVAVRFAWPDAPSGMSDHLFTYRQGGVACVRNRVENLGATVSRAVVDCSAVSDDSPVLYFTTGILL